MIIDGKKIAAEVRANLKEEIKKLNIVPGLAIILIGHNEASEIYDKNKLKACEEIGINGKLYRFNENDKEDDVIKCLKKLNEDKNVHGIIIQSPVPANFNEEYLNSFIDPSKDVDGFGIYNMGLLASNTPSIIAATPKGILKMLEYENIDVRGKNVVVVGRSKIVGRPLALALLNKDATVTICHSKTKNLQEITSKADILITAIGKAKYITSDYIKEGAVVIDVGMNRDEAGKLCGDVDFNDVVDKVSYITPVPGGVGPMTVAMLLTNVYESAKKIQERG